jgi:hypothetical protein
MVASSAAKETLWLCKFAEPRKVTQHFKLLSDLQCDINCVLMFADNQGATKVIKHMHPNASSRTEFFYVMHHFVREKVA